MIIWLVDQQFIKTVIIFIIRHESILQDIFLFLAIAGKAWEPLLLSWKMSFHVPMTENQEINSLNGLLV